ncbi:MAG: MFS transporter [Acidimicrobiia bacterium]|nr:MFS transporter [Acidimicrobiia bacterium]
MPHVRRRLLVQIDAPPEAVHAAAVSALGVATDDDGWFVGQLFDHDSPGSTLRLRAEPAADGSAVWLEGGSSIEVPYFGWLVRFVVWVVARRVLKDWAVRLRAAVAGDPVPPARHHRTLIPASFTADEAMRIAVLAAVGAVAYFGGSLFTQMGDPVARSFHESDSALSFAFTLARIGVVMTLVAAALADRYGRRRLIIIGLVGICVANAIAAAAPSWEVFTGAQVLARGFSNGTLVITAIAVIEDAPERARAFAISLLGLALGIGFGCAVALLPVADLGADGWRVPFALSALSIVLIASIARGLRETRRFTQLVVRPSLRARLLEPFDRRYGGRFLLLGLIAFFINAFSAPSSQLTNRYLTGTHDFSNSQVALLRGVTTGAPGIVGVLMAGRIAESRGRRPVIIVGLLVATVFQAAFFLGSGALLWIAPMVSVVASAFAGIGVGTTSGELFPTESRSSSNGFLLIAGIAGAAVGLLLAPEIKTTMGGLGPAIAVLGVAPLIAAFFLVPRLPETRARNLDEISPSEV